MDIQNVHPEFLRKIQEQVPSRLTVESFASETPTTSLVVFKDGDYKITKRINKTDISSLLTTVTKEVEVCSGDSLASVVELFSVKYELNLLGGVDYSIPKGVVDFSNGSLVEFTLDILPDSIGLFGNTVIRLVDKQRIAKDSGVLEIGSTDIRLKLALVSKVFKLDGGNIFSGNQLTMAFCDLIITHLSDLEFDRLTKEHLSTSKITHVTNDGISDICFLRISDERLIPIRYSSGLDDQPKLV